VDVTRLGLAAAGGLPVSYRISATHPTNTRTYPTRTCTTASSALYTGDASCTITTLVNGQTYNVSAVAINTRGTSTTATATTDPTDRTPRVVAPGVVSAVVGTDRGTGGTVRVSWAAPRDTGGAPMTGYRVEVSADGGATWLTSVENTNSSSLFTDVSGLTDGEAYAFRVSARNYIGWGAASDLSRVVRSTGPPGFVRDLSVTAANTGLLVEIPRLGLAAAGGLPVSYRVSATHTSNTRSFPTRSCTVASISTYTGTASCLVTGLTNGQNYRVSVVAVNTRGTGRLDPDSDAFAVPVPVAPSVPVSVSGVDRGVGGAVRVSWVAPRDTGGAPMTGYRVEVSADGGATWLTSVENTNSPALFTDVVVMEEGTPLVNGSSYLFRVSARNAIGWSAASAASRPVAPTGLPEAPSISTVTPDNARLGVDVTRLGLAAAGGLPVSYRISATHPTNTRTYPTRTCTTASSALYTGEASCTITTLVNGQTYNVSAVAINTRGISTTATATTDPTDRTPRAVTPVLPSAPTDLLATAGDSQASISFTVGAAGTSPISNYQFSINNGSTWIPLSPITVTSPVVITGLVNFTTYSIRLRAVSAAGTSPASELVSVTPRVIGEEPNDPYYSNGSLWGLNGIYGVNAIGGWSRTYGDQSIVVAVVDTGGTTHPDAGPTVPGYDMISDPMLANDLDGRDSNPSDPGDWITSAESSSGYLAGCTITNSSWHGTHVAGTINAAANSIGIVGVAPNVRVQHVRALGKCGGYTSDIAAGIIWASGGSVLGVPSNSTPAKVINLSLGGFGTCSLTYQTAIDTAVGRGSTVVVSAGNSNDDSQFHRPANCNNVVVAASIDSNGKRWSSSNYGAAVDIAAPGVQIFSNLNTGSRGPVNNTTYGAYSGTSMAAPHVSGVIALMLSRDPTLTPSQIETRLKVSSNVTPFGGGVCDSQPLKTCGAGIINAGQVVP
jgi:subtilisin family serine protease